jgi:hypothetical protein
MAMWIRTAAAEACLRPVHGERQALGNSGLDSNDDSNLMLRELE